MRKYRHYCNVIFSDRISRIRDLALENKLISDINSKNLKKYIETEYEDRHIENLNKANVPYVVI